MPLLVPLWKGLRILEHLLTGAVVAVVVAAGRRLGYRVVWLDDVVCWWYRRLLRCMRVRVQAEGTIATGALLVANHVSWLDIPAIGTRGMVRFLSKAEVRGWPLVGWMSELAGTFFIARGANRVGAAVEQIRACIQGGHPVVVFPEGTTSDGRQVHRFHPRLFAVCQQAGLAVQPSTGVSGWSLGLGCGSAGKCITSGADTSSSACVSPSSKWPRANAAPMRSTMACQSWVCTMALRPRSGSQREASSR